MIFTKQILGVVSIAAFALGGCVTVIDSGNEQDSVKSGSDVAQAAQASDPAEKFDITKLTCWEISTLSEADVGYAAILLYGYNAGQSGIREHSGNRIEGAITKAIETCAANPDMMAIEAVK